MEASDLLPAPCGSSRYCIAVQRCRKHEHRDPGLVPGSGAGPVACTKGQYRFSRGPATLASAPLSLVPPQKARSAAVQGFQVQRRCLPASINPRSAKRMPSSPETLNVLGGRVGCGSSCALRPRIPTFKSPLDSSGAAVSGAQAIYTDVKEAMTP